MSDITISPITGDIIYQAVLKGAAVGAIGMGFQGDDSQEAFKDGAYMAGGAVISSAFLGQYVDKYAVQDAGSGVPGVTGVPPSFSVPLSDGLAYAGLKMISPKERHLRDFFMNGVIGIAASWGVTALIEKKKSELTPTRSNLNQSFFSNPAAALYASNQSSITPAVNVPLSTAYASL